MSHIMRAKSWRFFASGRALGLLAARDAARQAPGSSRMAAQEEMLPRCFATVEGVLGCVFKV